MYKTTERRINETKEHNKIPDRRTNRLKFMEMLRYFKTKNSILMTYKCV